MIKTRQSRKKYKYEDLTFSLKEIMDEWTYRYMNWYRIKSLDLELKNVCRKPERQH